MALRRPVVAALATLAILMVVAAYYLGHMHGYMSAYKAAEEGVFNEAWGAGYLAGYAEGNATGFSNGYEAGRAEGYMEGYKDGLRDGAGRGSTLRDPAYSEVLDFIEVDETDKLRYSPEGYTFLDLAARFKASAMAFGLRCCIAIFILDSGLAVLNGFNTTDRGMVYIEPWSDRALTVRVGDLYGASRVLKIVNIW